MKTFIQIGMKKEQRWRKRQTKRIDLKRLSKTREQSMKGLVRKFIITLYSYIGKLRVSATARIRYPPANIILKPKFRANFCLLFPCSILCRPSAERRREQEVTPPIELSLSKLALGELFPFSPLLGCSNSIESSRIEVGKEIECREPISLY